MKSIFLLSCILLTVLLLASCSVDDNNSIKEELTNEKLQIQPITTIINQFRGICGVTEGNDQMPVSDSQMNELINSLIPLPSINVTVQYHIVRKSNGTDGVPTSDLDLMTTKLNQDFSQALYGCLQFPIGPERLTFINDGTVNYIDSDELHTMDNTTEFNQLINTYNDPTKLNIYIVKQFEPTGILGRAKLRGNGAVISRYNNAYLGTTVAHEIGHNFGLNHLSYNSRGLLCEYETQNCSPTTGDLIADTPISTSGFTSLVDENCELDRTTSHPQTCDNGITLTMGKFDILFSAKNIMRTRTEGPCRIGFTGMQHMQMNQGAINLGLGQE